MKVLFTFNELALSGAPVAGYNVAKYFREKGHEVYVLSPSDGELNAQLTELGIQVLIHPNALNASEVVYSLCKQGVELVVAYTSLSYQCVLGAKGAGAKVIWSLHEAKLAGLDLFRENYIAQNALAQADMVVYNSEYCKEAFSRFATKKQTRIYVGIENVVGLEDRPKDESAFKVLTIGSIEPRKNQLLAMNVAKLSPDIQFSIIGRPLDQGYHQNLVAVSKSLPNTTIEMPTSRHLIRQRLKDADALLITSLEETLPIVLSEAQNLGVPVVAARINGIPEAIINGRTGYLYDAGDYRQAAKALADLKENKELRSQIAEEALKAQQTLRTYEYAGAKFLELISKI